VNRQVAEAQSQGSFSCPSVTTLAEPSAGAFSLPGSAGGAGAPYKDVEAQVLTHDKAEIEKVKLQKNTQAFEWVGKCGSLFQVADDVPGLHHFGKRILCYQEWCSRCGKMDSAAHQRRKARWIDKARQLKQAGYVTIEWPLADRGKLRIQESWRNAMDTAGGVLFGKHTKRQWREGGFFLRGLEAWHWFNDDKPGYRADVFNPHMNFLVDASSFGKRGKMSREELAEFKGALREAFGIPKLIVHYNYGDNPGWIFHKLRYITRATFLNREWDNALADELYGFRRTRSFGKWNDEPVWDLKEAEAEGENTAGLEAVSLLQKHICPCCGAQLAVRGYKMLTNPKTGQSALVIDRKTGLPMPIYWSKPLPSILLEASEAMEIGSHYYQIPAGWFEPESKRERVNMADMRRVNAGRLKELRKQAGMENWRRYVSANWNRYILSGGELQEVGHG